MFATRLREIFDHVEPCEQHKGVFSHELRMLYMLACMEVESACKAVLEANGARPAKRRKDFNVEDYGRLAAPMRLDDWTVQLSADPEYGLLTPFEEWGPGKSGQLKWYSDHNKVKHSREKSLKLATLENTLQALAGVYVIRQAQFGSFDGDVGFPRDEFEIAMLGPMWTDAEQYVPPETTGPDGKPLATQWTPLPHTRL